MNPIRLIPAALLGAAILCGACNAPKSDGTAKHDTTPATTPAVTGTTTPASASTPTPALTPAAGIFVTQVTNVEGELGSGTAAPNFTWTGSDGQQRSLKDYRGKVVMLNFWGTWCPPCRAELPDIVKLRNELNGQGFEVIGLGVNERARAGKTAEQTVADFASKNGLNYPLLIASDELIMAYGGIEGVPTTFILNGKGEVVERMVGMRDEASFRASIKKAM